jgi:hypothetical protein
MSLPVHKTHQTYGERKTTAAPKARNAMKRKTLWTTLDLVIEAMQKLDAENGERKNVLAFIQSCYCGRVRDYDFDAALASLHKLTPEEQHALIEYAMSV